MTLTLIDLWFWSRPAQAYFEGFGPKYVEWLTDWSFNVVFEDEEEARRAVASKSFALPESLPQGVRVRP